MNRIFLRHRASSRAFAGAYAFFFLVSAAFENFPVAS
jgi:hypothetical protein